MKKTFDLFAGFPVREINDLDQLKKDFKSNPLLRARLLSAALGDDTLKELARADYRSLVHQRGRTSNPYDQQVIAPRLKLMKDFRLLDPNPAEALSRFPASSFFLQIGFTLSEPYISRDDEAFYIIDNPLKKEKVFNVPYIAAASWKGNLRWTMMYLRIALPLEKKKRELLDAVCQAPAQKESEAFAIKLAAERLRQTLLFGSEQGWQEERAGGWADYLNNLLGELAEKQYRALLRKHFKVAKDDPIPHSQGRLQFFPAYLDKIDLEVINPHDRKTRTGKQPIYFEVAPAGAKGIFSLIYTPFDLVGDRDASRAVAPRDLEAIIEGVQGLMFTYGFSAKKSSGFGVVDSNSIAGRLQVNDPDWNKRSSEWKSFTELLELAQEWAQVSQAKGALSNEIA